MVEEPGNVYDAYYYQTGCGRPYQRDEEWLASFDQIAERIVREFNPCTVLDAGCAMGFLVECLRKRGVEAYGIDISEYAISQVHPDIRPFCRVGSIAEPFPQKYDLIVTIEVLEHMPKEEAEKTIANFCQSTNDVLFSSGNRDFREITHFNMQTPEYWAGQFARHGFFRDVDFDATFITAWTVRFRRKNEPIHRIVMDYERQIDWLIQENLGLRQMNLEQKNFLAQTQAANAQLNAVYASRTYNIARRMRSIVPPGSGVEKLILRFWNVLATVRHQGLRGLFKKGA
jgi:SAM-dependent methyltransferase